jgi:hypothetical protein
MVVITPHLGIGDLIILKMSALSNNLDIKQININDHLVRTYTSDYHNKIQFIKHMVKFLFPAAICNINNSPPDFVRFRNTYRVNHIYLYDHVDMSSVKRNKSYDGAIVFHTKLRYDGLIDKFNAEFLPSLTLFLKTFKTDKQIVLVGEQTIGQNIETQIHKTLSLYDVLLLLKENNTVIDLTKVVLTEGTAFDDFLQDIEIINKAACNVTFGIGGPLSITSAFSKKNIAVIPFLNQYPEHSMCRLLQNTICETVTELEDTFTFYKK